VACGGPQRLAGGGLSALSGGGRDGDADSSAFDSDAGAVADR